MIPLHLPPGDTSQERTVQIDGTSEQIESAKQLVDEVISEVCLSLYIADFLVGSFHILCTNDKSVFMWDKSTRCSSKREFMSIGF